MTQQQAASKQNASKLKDEQRVHTPVSVPATSHKGQHTTGALCVCIPVRMSGSEREWGRGGGGGGRDRKGGREKEAKTQTQTSVAQGVITTELNSSEKPALSYSSH